MVHHLSLAGLEVQIAVNFIVEERANPRSSQPQRFRGEIKPVSDGSSFEIYITIAAVAMRTGGAIEIGDHGERYTGIARQILPQAQPRRREALIAGADRLQFPVLRPVPIDAGIEAVH